MAMVIIVIVIATIGEAEIGFGFRAVEGACGGVVSVRGFLGGVEGTEPNPGFLHGVPYLGCESPPWPLSDPTVARRIGGDIGNWLLYRCRRRFPVAHGLREKRCGDLIRAAAATALGIDGSPELGIFNLLVVVVPWLKTKKLNLS